MCSCQNTRPKHLATPDYAEGNWQLNDLLPVGMSGWSLLLGEIPSWNLLHFSSSTVEVWVSMVIPGKCAVSGDLQKYCCLWFAQIQRCTTRKNTERGACRARVCSRPNRLRRKCTKGQSRSETHVYMCSIFARPFQNSTSVYFFRAVGSKSRVLLVWPVDQYRIHARMMIEITGSLCNFNEQTQKNVGWQVSSQIQNQCCVKTHELL